MRKVWWTALWATLTVIGVILTIPYSLLEIFIDQIDNWTEKIEFNILDSGNNEDKENGSDNSL